MVGKKVTNKLENIIRNYLSFSGRINRKSFWIRHLKILITGCIFYVVFYIIAFLLGETFGKFAFVFLERFGFLGTLFASMICSVSLFTRRLHDRGIPAWWYVIYSVMLPIATWILYYFSMHKNLMDDYSYIFIFLLFFNFISFGINFGVFVICGFIKGTKGKNRFGPDPLEEKQVSLRDFGGD